MEGKLNSYLKGAVRRGYFEPLLTCLLIVLIGFSFSSRAYCSEIQGFGLAHHSEEHLDHLERNWPRIHTVRPNKLGAKRIHAHLKKYNQVSAHLHEAETHEDEIMTDAEVQSNGLFNQLAAPTSQHLPHYVNNSLRPSFPPIGNQGEIGSCVAWASTYYQASHEIGMLNGYNNKTSLTHVLSPKWTYNILNGGHDGGLMILDAYSLLSKNGAASIENFPYDGNYLAWDMHPEDWVSAISRRTTAANIVTGLGGKNQNLKVIKELLNNGHVLTIGTFISSWVFTTVRKDPSNRSNPFAGQLAASWVNGSNGGHCMTIVGYDDDIWIDINHNGKVDPGEKGAFLIANSWGTDWGNEGFIWVAYDAFLSTSAVPRGPNRRRVAAGAALNSLAVSVLPIAANYKPRLVAQFTVKQSHRNEIAVAVGISDQTQERPSQTFKSGAVVYQGGGYEFDGKAPGAPRPGTFAVDLTDLITSRKSSDSFKRFYLLLNDAKAKHPTTLTSFSLIDPICNKTVSSQNLPIVCNHTQVTPYIDYDCYGAKAKRPPVVSIASPVEGESVEGNLEVIVSVTDHVDIDRIEFYVDGVYFHTDKTTPYLMPLNTTVLSDGIHELSAIAYDTLDNTTEATLKVYVDNRSSSRPLHSNVYGDEFEYRGRPSPDEVTELVIGSRVAI